jgi:hypothetical protein
MRPTHGFAQKRRCLTAPKVTMKKAILALPGITIEVEGETQREMFEAFAEGQEVFS